MLQIYVYDDTGARYELDLYKEEPLKLTLSVEDTKDLPRVNSAFSQSFRIPATQANSRVFQWWYEVNTVDFDITRRVAADIYVDGLFYKSGHIRIQAAYVDDETSQVDLEIVFFGETRDFASQIGENTLNQLNLTSLNHELTLTNVQNSWAGTLANGDVRYALAVRGYDYDDQGNIVQDSEIAEQQEHSGNASFQKVAHPLKIDQLTPTVRVKSIIDAIFAQTGYSYSSDSFFTTTLFNELYTDTISDASATFQQPGGTLEALSTGQELGPFENFEYVEFPNEISDPANAFAGNLGFYYPPVAGNYTMAISLNLRIGRSLAHTTPTYTIRVRQGANIIDTKTVTVPFGVFPINITDTLSMTLEPLVAGTSASQAVVVEVKVENGTFNNEVQADSSWDVTTAPSSVSIASLMKYDVKCVDFLKSILTKFKLIMVPNPDNEFEFIIKPWKDYIGSGDRLDWTEKLDLSKTVQLKPIFFEQSQLIDFTDQPDEDIRNKPFQEEEGRTYGALQFDSQNDLLVDTKTIDTIFAPTPVDVVPGFPDTSSFVVPYFCKEDPGKLTKHNAPEKLPMKIKPRLLFWNGLAAQGANEDWYYTDGTTVVHNTTNYPRFTPYSVFPTTSATINLNWFRETPYFVGPNDGKSVYEEYWNLYIQELYSKDARVMTAYFNLDSQDMRILSFDDVIFIKNAYWRILKVYDAPLSEVATVKVDLVKILETLTFRNSGNPTPSGGGIDDVVVTGGGGSPAEATLRLYALQTCINPGDFVYAYYQSASPLTAGQSVTCSGVTHAGICYEVIDITTQAPTTAILDVFPDCLSCSE